MAFKDSCLWRWCSAAQSQQPFILNVPAMWWKGKWSCQTVGFCPHLIPFGQTYFLSTFAKHSASQATHLQYYTHIPITPKKKKNPTNSAVGLSSLSRPDREGDPAQRMRKQSAGCLGCALPGCLCVCVLILAWGTTPFTFPAVVETAREDIALHKLHPLFTDKLQPGGSSLYIHCHWQAVSSCPFRASLH